MIDKWFLFAWFLYLANSIGWAVYIILKGFQ